MKKATSRKKVMDRLRAGGLKDHQKSGEAIQKLVAQLAEKIVEHDAEHHEGYMCMTTRLASFANLAHQTLAWERLVVLPPPARVQLVYNFLAWWESFQNGMSEPPDHSHAPSPVGEPPTPTDPPKEEEQLPSPLVAEAEAAATQEKLWKWHEHFMDYCFKAEFGHGMKDPEEPGN